MSPSVHLREQRASAVSIHGEGEKVEQLDRATRLQMAMLVNERLTYYGGMGLLLGRRRGPYVGVGLDWRHRASSDPSGGLSCCDSLRTATRPWAGELFARMHKGQLHSSSGLLDGTT